MSNPKSDKWIYQEKVLFEAERACINRGRPPEDKTGPIRGLALSGGGIRSAAFGLGVLQALEGKGKFRWIDYLSTVSGGGYIGTSLTWFLHRAAGAKGSGNEAETKGNTFPFGVPAGKGHEQDRNKVLDYIRQNASYLTPGGGLGVTALLAAAFRGLFITLFVYGVFGLVAMRLLKLLVDVATGGPSEPGVGRWLGSVLHGSPPQGLSWLLVLAVGLIGALFVSALLFALSTSSPWGGKYRYRNRLKGQRLLGAVWALVGGLVVLGTLPIVFKILEVALDSLTLSGLLVGVGSVTGFFMTRGGQLASSDQENKLKKMVPALASVALVYGLLLGWYAITERTASWEWESVIYIGLLVLAAVVGLSTNPNYAGHHRIYRDRLMELFMPDKATVDGGRWKPATEANDFMLKDVRHERPYHLINTNVVLINSEVGRYRDRGGDSFILSREYCGSTATGWRPTAEFAKHQSGGITLASAMAISAAAMNPNTGPGGQGLMRNRLVSVLMSLLNLRLGCWMEGPLMRDLGFRRPTLLNPGLDGTLGIGFRESGRFLDLSDGGHFDNTGLYELLRRKVSVIILSDAGADPDFRFSDLASVMERARVDFGTKIRFRDERGLSGLLPCSARSSDAASKAHAAKYKLAQRGHAVADIEYDDGSEGVLVFIKTTLVPGLPADVYGYRNENPTFPDQTTGDQFFDERQFEAYRELGYQLCENALEDDEVRWP